MVLNMTFATIQCCLVTNLYICRIRKMHTSQKLYISGSEMIEQTKGAEMISNYVNLLLPASKNIAKNVIKT